MASFWWALLVEGHKLWSGHQKDHKPAEVVVVVVVVVRRMMWSLWVLSLRLVDLVNN